MTAINFLLRCNVCIFSELLILTLFLISKFYFPAISGWLFLSTLILPFGSFLYIKLYTWHKLSMSNFSFLRFMLILIQGLLLLISIYFIVFKTITEPIYIENLSLFSQYKYLFFCIVTVFVAVLLFISFLFNYNISSWFSFLNLQEEMRVILKTWHDSIFAHLFSNLMEKMYASHFVLLSYFIIDFSLFYIIRFIILIYFFRFIYFNADLRIVLYFVPVLFIIWLLSFFRYYFLTFRQETCNYIKSLVTAKTADKTVKANVFRVINIQKGVYLNLTEEAVKSGFTAEDISLLAKEWFFQAGLAIYFDLYSKITRWFGFILLILRIVAWFSIVILFFNTI